MEVRLREALRLLRAFSSFFSSFGSSGLSSLASGLSSALASVDFFGAAAAVARTGLLRALWVFL